MDISLDYKSEIPIYVQLKNQLRYLIQSQQLEPERQLPTMRQLALDLGIDANTVARVYRELEEEGLIERQQGRGTFVTPTGQHQARTPSRSEAEAVLESAVRLLRGMNVTDAEVADLLRGFADRFKKE
ncbi:MAG: hypothetical protein A2Y63_01740 [Candidatus Riflebacteria bacterium RBG_13_59_9]|nr:MAG: hypothetical protein A2Y63_01740 [Candidatus Riflebacteria bacterium RBG_13_59_9]